MEVAEVGVRIVVVGVDAVVGLVLLVDHRILATTTTVGPRGSFRVVVLVLSGSTCSIISSSGMISNLRASTGDMSNVPGPSVGF